MNTKEILENIFKKLETCTQSELKEYATNLYMQKQEFDTKAWSFIERAIDVQEEYFRNLENPLAIRGEIKESEI
jgi:hypothetical protein